jgi:hypothetical protein
MNDIKWDNEAPTPAAEEGIKWDVMEAPASTKPKARDASTFSGVTQEFLKGLPRGAVDYMKQLGAGLDPRGQQAWGPAMPKDKLPAVDPGIGQLKQQFDQAVAPDPQATGLERFAGATGEFVGGFAGGGGPRAASTSRTALPAVPTPAKTMVMRELRDADILLSPSQMGGPVSQAMAGVSGKARVDTMLQNANVPRFQGMAAQSTGVPVHNITEEALSRASREVSDATYQPIRDLGQIHLGSHNVGHSRYSSTFQRELDDISARYASAEGHASLDNAVNSLRVREMPANVALERVQQIRNDAGAAFKRGDRNIGRALREVSESVENQIERNLAQRNPQQVVEAYRAGRQQIARNNAVKDMLVDPHTGIVDPVKAQQLLEDGVRLDGPLLTIAKAGSPEFAAATRAPKSKALPFDTSDAWMSGGALGIGGAGALFGAGAAGGGIGLATALAIPAARTGMRHGLVSNAGQRAMTRNLYDQPGMLGMSPEFIQRMMTGGTGLFSDGSQ